MEEVPSDDSPKSDAHMAPHVLAMSATPIPRTLALALYGDMSLTEVFSIFCILVFLSGFSHFVLHIRNISRRSEGDMSGG